ncbi:MAG TPA: MarR family transcriptional regulator [Mycobacteriales bacterium]
MQRNSDEDRPASASDVLLSASRALVAIAARSLGPIEDQVTLAQYRALVVIAARGPLRPADLAAELDVTPSTATRLCDRLSRKKLINRSHRESDRREVELTLAAEGRKLVNDVTARRRRDLRRVLARISPEQQGQLVESMRLFTEAAGEVPEGSWALGLTP